MPKTARPLTVHPPTLREVEVARIVDLTPGMRRITLTGYELGAFTSTGGFEQPPFRSDGFDDDIRLLFSYPGENAPILPSQGDRSLHWPKEPRPLYKVYTVRRWDPESVELDVDFVKHGTGTATTWAYRAKPGDRIHFFGPHSSRALPTGVDWWLIAGDDTALPAIQRLLEELPEDARGQVFIEVAEDDHRQPLREIPGIVVTWLSRGGQEPGSVNLLLDAVKHTPWWSGNPFAWIAGESAIVRDLRRHLVEDRGLPKTDVDFTGYWKRSEVVPLADDMALPDPEKSSEALDRFHDLTELIPPIAIRVAAGLGLGDLISRGIGDATALAQRTGSDERALAKLLRYLHSIDLLAETEPGCYELTEVGDFLEVEFWTEMLDPNGVVGRMEVGILGLAESIRTGQAAYPSVTGKTFSQVREEQDFEDRYLEHTAQYAEYISGPLAASSALEGVSHLVVRSAGAGVEAREITAAHPDIHVTISVSSRQADWLARDLQESVPDPAQRDRITIIEQSLQDAAPAADAVLLVEALRPLADADAARALRSAATNLRPDGRVLVIETTFDIDELDEHDAETDLLALTRDGTGLRTPTELKRVFSSAGLSLAKTHAISWGNTIHELTSTV